jgi:hypothetical protein
MAAHLEVVPPVELDLTDEHGLLTEDYAEYNADGVRNLLAALNLRVPGAPTEREAVVIDMAIYAATGNAHLATIFSAAS